MNLQQTQELWKKLTDREIEIAQAAAAGSGIKQTAADLGISHKTVQNHRRKIIRKLTCGNMTRAVVIMKDGGLI